MEFTDSQIRDFAGDDATFAMGKKLCEENAIVSLDIDDYSSSDIIMINATIKSGKAYHEVNMSIDKDDVIVKANLCNCKEHGKTSLGCSHSVAVLCKLQEDSEKKQKTIEKDTMDFDPYAIDMINMYEKQTLYASLALTSKNAMYLEPVLEIRKKKILALTLKVGNEKRYVVKDVVQFLDDIAHNAKKSYGRELEFLHNLHSFDEESQRLIQFLINHQHDIFYFQNSNQYSSCPQTRNMCMTPNALDEFFELYKDSDVMYRIKEKTLINLRFLDEHPALHLDIQINNQNLYEISIQDFKFRLFVGAQHSYILWNHTLYRLDSAYTQACTPFLQTLFEKQAPLLIHRDLMPNFYHNVIMNVKAYIPIHGVDISEFTPSPLECKLYIDMPQHNVISARLLYCYGVETFNTFSTHTTSFSRNINEETAIRLLFTKYMTRVDANEGIAYIEHSQDAIYDFLVHGMDELSNFCEIYASEEFKRLQIKKSMKISMGVRIKSDLLEIQFDTHDFPMDELQQVLQAYRLNKKYYRMKNGSFVNIEDSALQELSSILDGMHVSKKELQSSIIKVPKYRSLYLDNRLKSATMMKVDRDSSFKDIVRGIQNVKDSDYHVPDSLKHILRNYQKVGYRWLKTMTDYGFCGILADDMGIGKTIQVITLLEDEKLQQTHAISLVVCPSSLILNWQSEIEKFSKTLTCCLISGTSAERKQLLETYNDYDVIITSYDYLKRDIDLYTAIEFKYQIIDEAQYIKNHVTKNAISVKHIHATHRFALTGTPIENSLAELWSIFDYLMPGYLYTYSYFKKAYEVPIVKEKDQTSLSELQRMVQPFILRRVKKDVLKELPEKVENTMFVEIDEEARKLYMANVSLIKTDLQKSFKEKGYENSKLIILSMLTKLRQLCCDPRLLYENFTGIGSKVKVCMEYIKNCQESNKKVLVFSQFTSLLSLLEEELIRQDTPYYLLKGSTPKMLRQQLVNSFNTNATPVFLISLKAGGTGLNLTSAEVVIHFDPWWNISAQNQATDRAYRIGQHNNVQVVKLIAKDTIEEKILQLQSLKQGLSDSIIFQNEGMINQMSKDELMNLF